MKDLTAEKMKKTGLYGYVYDFSADYGSIDVDDILDIHKHFMKNHDIKFLNLLKNYLLDY